ncbi:hypothetical protein AQUSIP_12320 [Aquicella siphonis]|uniref:CBU-0592-like domain-containing protein n=1 Tax=Aquicella siphonis TaxID=254247 RepID=A0A5E4PHY1_9COXI|nr:hypothetical protein [Aquicella siphonis]VVC75931.1 hypothetical protein AQUSIP_12320 [Aquicella siphonis]
MIYDLLAKSSDAVGIAGVILLLIAYFQLSTNRISAQTMNYQLYNFTGALFILFSLLFHFNLSSFLIEFAWIIISLIGIYRIQAARRQNAGQAGNLYKLSDAKKKL